MKKILLSIISILIIYTNVFAQDIETKKVISTGVGLTESDALKDTTRNAVQQVVGAYILTETYVKNSQIIKDEILTNSNGFVKGFKIISQTKEDNGLVKIEAEVEVEPSNVTKRLGELNISLKDVATTEFKAIALDKFQATKDFKNMFEEIVLKPIKDNKKIYDIKIGELRSVNELPNYFSISSRDDTLIPFILSFSIDFKKEYIDSVDSFLEKASIKRYQGDNFKYNSNNTFNYVDLNLIKNDDSHTRNIYTYIFDDTFKNSYHSLVENFRKSYKPVLTIKLNDFNGKQVKIFEYLYGDYRIHGLAIEKKRKFSLFDSMFHRYWSGVDLNSNNLTFFYMLRNLEFGMYLNEEEVNKIKGVSIEIKWEEKSNDN